MTTRNTVHNDYGTFASTPVTLVRDPELSANAKALYAVIWSYSDERDRDAFPGRKTLAAHLAVSVDTVDRAIRELVAYGALAVEHGFDGDRQTTNTYRILQLAKREGGAAPMRLGGRTSAEEGGRTHAAPGGRTHAAQDQEPEDQEPEDQEPHQPPTPIDIFGADELSAAEATVDALLDITEPTVDELFDDFWTVWPRKEARKLARQKFDVAIATARKQLRAAGVPMSRPAPTVADAAAFITAAAAWWARHWRDVEHRTLDRIPHPSTWLNQERWNDERPTPDQYTDRRSPTRTEQNLSVVAKYAAAENVADRLELEP